MKQNGRRHTYSHYYYNGRNGMHEISMLCNDASEEKSDVMSNMSFITHFQHSRLYGLMIIRLRHNFVHISRVNNSHKISILVEHLYKISA